MNRPTRPAWMCVDVETTGLDWHRDQLHGIGVSYDGESGEYYPVWDISEQTVKDLEDSTIVKLGHNIHAFDAKFIRKAGIDIQGDFSCTMVMANLIDTDQELGLKFLADKYLGHDSLESKRHLDRYCQQQGARHVGELCAKDLLNTSHPHLDVISEYCIEDTVNTARLGLMFLDVLRDLDRDMKSNGFKKSPLDYYYDEARPLERVLFEMEYRGIRIDLGVIEDLRRQAVSQMSQCVERLTVVFAAGIDKVEDDLVTREQAKVSSDKAKATRVKGHGKCQFQWSNPGHVGQLLHVYPRLRPLLGLTSKGKIKTDKAAIDRIIQADLDDTTTAAMATYLRYKLHEKTAGTYTGTSSKGIMSKIRYVDGVPRIFPVYRQTTGTGRLACSNPNMQNLKRDSDVKRMFIPDDDTQVFHDFDYSQIELRVAAHLSNDPGLVSAYQTGEDVHLKTASRLFDRSVTKADTLERQAGKRTNFLTIFDGGAYRLQASLLQETGRDFSTDDCEKFIRVWFELYSLVRVYLDAQLVFFQRHGWCVSDTGRVRQLRDIHVKDSFTWIDGHPRYTGGSKLRHELLQTVYGRFGSGCQVTHRLLWSVAVKRYNHTIKSGYNQPIQGLAASMTKRAMIELYRRGIIPVNQVHDSIVVAADYRDVQTPKIVEDVMKTVYQLRVPVEVDSKTTKSLHPEDLVNGKD